MLIGAISIGSSFEMASTFVSVIKKHNSAESILLRFNSLEPECVLICKCSYRDILKYNFVSNYKPINSLLGVEMLNKNFHSLLLKNIDYVYFDEYNQLYIDRHNYDKSILPHLIFGEWHAY